MRTWVLLGLFVTSMPSILTAQQAPGRLCMGNSRPAAGTVVADKTAAPAATISQVAWLAGTWSGSAGTTTVEERWTPPAGGSMMSIGRTLRNGGLVAFEFVCIVERGGGLVYTAMPNGQQPPTDFAMTKIEARSITFENPAHDFPKMIRYSLKPDGMLEAAGRQSSHSGRKSRSPPLSDDRVCGSDARAWPGISASRNLIKTPDD